MGPVAVFEERSDGMHAGIGHKCSPDVPVQMEYIGKVARYRLIIRFADVDPDDFVRLVIIIKIGPETVSRFRGN